MDNIIEILLKIKDKNDLYLSLLNELVESRMLIDCFLYKNGIIQKVTFQSVIYCAKIKT